MTEYMEQETFPHSGGQEVFAMKKGLTEPVFILDRSGSMGGLEGDIIGGFNAMIDKLYVNQW